MTIPVVWPIKIILIIAVFAFFIYRKKFSAFLAKRKTKHISEKDTKDPLTVSAVSSGITRDVSSGDSPSGIPEQRFSTPYRYEAYAFDYAQYPETEHFADRITAKLDVIEMSMQNKWHYIKFIELGTCLLVLVKYQD